LCLEFGFVKKKDKTTQKVVWSKQVFLFVSLNLVSLKKRQGLKSGLEQTSFFVCVPEFGFAKKRQNKPKSGLEQTSFLFASLNLVSLKKDEGQKAVWSKPSLFVCVPEFGFAKKKDKG